MIAALGWLWRGGVLGILAFLIFGPLANLVPVGGGNPVVLPPQIAADLWLAVLGRGL